jgi:hypothetical protein
VYLSLLTSVLTIVRGKGELVEHLPGAKTRLKFGVGVTEINETTNED